MSLPLRQRASYSRSHESVGGAGGRTGSRAKAERSWGPAPCPGARLPVCAVAGEAAAAEEKDKEEEKLRLAARSELPAALPRFIGFTRFCFRRSNHVTGETSPFPRGRSLCSGQSETYI